MGIDFLRLVGLALVNPVLWALVLPVAGVAVVSVLIYFGLFYGARWADREASRALRRFVFRPVGKSKKYPCRGDHAHAARSGRPAARGVRSENNYANLSTQNDHAKR